MGLVDEIPSGSVIALDTNPIIYFIEERAPYLQIVAPIFEAIDSGQLSGVVSAVSLTEVLVRPLRQREDALAQRYRSILTRSDHITFMPLDASRAWLAASLRARYGLKTPDAIVAATAQDQRCWALLTNDARFNIRSDPSGAST